MFIPFAADVYAFRRAFCTILPCIQHQNALCLAPKRTAFSTKTHCIQHQNALHLAPKRTAFSTKHTSFSSKQPLNGCKWWLFEINIQFTALACYPLFASKQTFARIDFLRQGERLVDKKPLIMLKSVLKRLQNLRWQDCTASCSGFPGSSSCSGFSNTSGYSSFPVFPCFSSTSSSSSFPCSSS